jgi:predicted O-methyltransferase YrrM
MEILTQEVRTYLDALVAPRPPEMAAMEAWAREHDFPIIGPAAGQCCYLLTRLVRARRVFELGSGYGYSTAWFARAVRENGGGEVFHVVWDKALSQRARGHLAVLGLDDLVTFRVGEAVAALRETPGPFDVIFNDIDKAGYPESLSVIAEQLRPGGLLIIDNMLWHGRIFDEADRSPATRGIRETTTLLTESPDWVSTLIPIRDGLIAAMRR